MEWRVSDAPGRLCAPRSRRWTARGAIAQGTAPELVWLLEHPPLYTAGPAPSPRTWSRRVFRCTRPAAAGSSPITAPASAWLTRCSTSTGAARRAGLRRRAGGMDHPHAGRFQRARRAARRPRRCLGAAARKGPTGQPSRTRSRRSASACAVGDAARHLHQRRAGAFALFRHRALRRVRARYGVTSLADLGVHATMAEVDAVLRREFEALFGSIDPRGGALTP